MDIINCPNCGAHELEGKFCAYCGTQLFQDEPEIEIDPFMEEDSFEIPVGEYKGTNCSVILENGAFVISRSGGKQCVRIPYNELHGLYYCRPKDKFAAWGHLVVRWSGNAHLPLPDKKQRDYAAVKKNESIITFSTVAAPVYIQLFWFLKSKAPHWVKWEIENPDDLTIANRAFYQSVDLEGYFKKYNPYRSSAIAALKKETGLRRKAARAIIYQAFDEMQRELYEREPNLAVRDLNRIVRFAIKMHWTWVIDI